MRKQILVGSLVALFLAGGAFAKDAAKKAPAHHAMHEESHVAAAGGHRMAGCGLGSLAIQDGSKWSQVGAAFLNGTGMQTFGITFGTSNCTEDGLAASNREKDAFVEANLSEIRHDLSVGSGDYLASLSSLYGCKGDQTVNFNRALRKHQDRLQQTAPEQASQIIDTVVTEEHASCLQQG